MFKLYFIVGLLLISVVGLAQNKTYKDSKIDSVFQQSFSFLDDVIKDSTIIENEASYKKFNNILDFLEDISGISSHRKGTFVGLIYEGYNYLKIDLDKWKKWYIENKSRLRWDNSKGEIILK